MCVQGPLQECRSIRSGASGLPYYRTPLVCVPAVFEGLAVSRHNKTKNQKSHKNSHTTTTTTTEPLVKEIKQVRKLVQKGKKHTKKYIFGLDNKKDVV